MKRRNGTNIFAVVLSVFLAITSGNSIAVNAATYSWTNSAGDVFTQPSTLEYTERDEDPSKYGFTVNRLSFTVIKDNTKVRKEASEKSEVLYTLDAGTEITVVGAAVNSHNNTWFILEDGGLIYCRNAVFNLKKNSLTEYYALIEAGKESRTAQEAILSAMFAEEGSSYFLNLLGNYGKNTEYVVVTDRNCIIVSPEEMKYIYYGYLSARLGYTKEETMLIASNGLAVGHVQENALEALDKLMIDTVIGPVLGGWLELVYTVISDYYELNGVGNDLDFVEQCKKDLCAGEYERNYISIGYDIGIADSN